MGAWRRGRKGEEDEEGGPQAKHSASRTRQADAPRIACQQAGAFGPRETQAGWRRRAARRRGRAGESRLLRR